MHKVFSPKSLVALLCLCLLLPAAAQAKEAAVSTGAGYKKMVEELCALYRQESGKAVTEMYGGNIGQVLQQVKAGSGVSVVISDQGTLDDSDVEFIPGQPLGEATLILAWKKGHSLSSPQDLLKPEIKAVGYPDRQAAIYGRAAHAYMSATGLLPKLEDKLSMLGTVPQVFSYLVSGDLDAAFVNTAIVKAQGDKVGGFMEISEGYEPLFLVAAVVKGNENDPEVQDFVKFLGSDKARSICAKHGLQMRK